MPDLVIEASADFGIRAGSVKFTPNGESARTIIDVEEIDLSDSVETKKIMTADALRTRGVIIIGRENTITIKGRDLAQLVKIPLGAIGWLQWETYGRGGKLGQNTTFFAMVKCTQDALGGSAKRDLAEYECQVEIIESADPTVQSFYAETEGKPVIVTGDAVVGGVVDIVNTETSEFLVALGGAPIGATVTIEVAVSAGDTTIEVSSGASLTFTDTNWSQTQPVVLGTNAASVGDMCDITVASTDTEYKTRVLTAKVIA